MAAAATWTALGLLLTMVGWFVAPLIASFMTKSKFIARLESDTSKKLKHLKIDILQLLEDTLPQLDEARIVIGGKTKSEVDRLHDLAAMLRHAQEDAEDILHDHKAIELYRSRWIESLWATGVACCTWIWVWIARIIWGGSAWLLQWFMGPGLANEDQGASRPGVPANEDPGASRTGDQVNEDPGASRRGVLTTEDPGASRTGDPVNEDPGASRRGVLTTEDPGASRQGARILRSGPAWLLQWFMGPGLANEDQGASRQGVRAAAAEGAPRQSVSSNEVQGDPSQGVSVNEVQGVSRQGARIVRSGSAWLQQWFKLPILGAGVRSKSTPLLPLTSNDPGDHGASQQDPGVPANGDHGASQQDPGVPANGDHGASQQDPGVPASEDHGASHQDPGVPASEDHGARIVRSRSAWLLQLFKVPVLVATATILVACVRSVSTRAPPLTSNDATSDGDQAAPSSSSFDVFKNRCRSTIDWLLSVYNHACLQRDLCYVGAGITSKQGIIDCIISAISRHNLKKRIDEVESTVNDVKSKSLTIIKSTPAVSLEKKSTTGVSSKRNSTPDYSSEENSAPDDIFKEKRREIRTGSNHRVFGLQEFRGTIMEKLRRTPRSSRSRRHRYSAIGIYGVSGSGKTTFAWYILEQIKQQSKDEKRFDTIMRIHVSKTFSVKEIFQNMLKDISNDHTANNLYHRKLRKKLKKLLRGKRFFLILDDFWVVDRNNKKLQQLESVLKVGKKGSKILVTAQNEAAAGALCDSDNKPVRMPVLSENQCLSILMHYALGDTSLVDRDEFKQVGRDIVKKLGRSPIAAVIVAARLGEKPDIKVWENIAERDMLSDTRAALWWSYKQFTPDIRRCFEYCNIFPKRIALEKGDVVSLWTAQGFVKTNGNEDMEAVAESYFQELLSFSFLKHEEDQWGGDFYRIHDMLHGLVDHVTGSDYFRIEYAREDKEEGHKPVVPPEVRHLFFQNYDAEWINHVIPELENLRTLIIYSVKQDTPVEEEVMESICKFLPKLRVLAVAFGSRIYQPKKFSFPESISRLKQLCYLGFRTGFSCEVICPSAFTELWHIRMLYFGHGQLCNIGRLTSLQELKEFTVRDEAGYELHQLGGLDKLRGTLEIDCLDSVNSQDEAVKANLSVKQGVRKLTLKWQRDVISQVVQVDHVLESLCPPMKLQELEIYNYDSSAYPSWMENREKGGPTDLKHLTLWRFGKQGGRPLQFVMAFPRLRLLSLWYCSWDALPGNMEDLASLEILLIFKCPNIQSLPTLPQSVFSISIHKCNVEFMKSCRTPGEENYQKVQHIKRQYIEDPLSAP